MTSAVHPPSVGIRSIADLIDLAADLKGELVAFAQSPRFARRLDALLFDAADRDGYLDEGTAVLTVDHFALQYRLPDGRTLVERFVTQRRPRLSDDEQKMMLGWRDVVEGCFEVGRCDGEAVDLHNLLDDLVYRVYSNMGRGALAQLRQGMFVVCRIVPLHPETDAWLISGHIAAYRKSARRQIAQTAAQQVTAHPELLRRNPAIAPAGLGGPGRAPCGLHRSGRFRPRRAATARRRRRRCASTTAACGRRRRQISQGKAAKRAVTTGLDTRGDRAVARRAAGCRQRRADLRRDRRTQLLPRLRPPRCSVRRPRARPRPHQPRPAARVPPRRVGLAACDPPSGAAPPRRR